MLFPMGKWFLDFSFWKQGYRTIQTAHCAIKVLLSRFFKEKKTIVKMLSPSTKAIKQHYWG